MKRKTNMALWIKRYGSLAKYFIAFTRSHQGALPWTRAISNINSRCNYVGDKKFKYYGGKGIKNLLTKEDLRASFLRDKAWKLRQPSVDRIRFDGHYEPSNIRWIEFDENRRRKASGARMARVLIPPGRLYGPPEQKVCVENGVVFYSRRRKEKFCSSRCRWRARARRYYHTSHPGAKFYARGALA